MTPAIEAEGLEKRHGTRLSVRDVSLGLPTGSTLVVFGANGAGKTTLLRILATIDRPSGGSLRVFGQDPSKSGAEIRSHVGLISHEPMLYPDLSARENLLLFARLYGVPDPKTRVAELLDAVRLSHRSHDAVREFSRGMMQRMSIARALVHDPDLVLLDEPFSGLDAHAQVFVQELVAGDTSCGRRTIVMTSHDLAHGYRLATHVLLLSAGRQITFGEKSQLPLDEFSKLYEACLARGASQ